MTMTIDDSRCEILAEVRAKRESALRFARTGTAREEEYWLGVAARMTIWIQHLERSASPAARWPHGAADRLRPIDLPQHARPVRVLASVQAAE